MFLGSGQQMIEWDFYFARTDGFSMGSTSKDGRLEMTQGILSDDEFFECTGCPTHP
jgi:hypothetical protein